jgi:vacuolar iron transporter family protein
MTIDLERYRASMCDELNGAALCAALAAAETDTVRKDLFLQLAQAESSQAQLWRDKLAVAGVRQEGFVPGFGTRLPAKLARRFGPRFVLPTIAAAEFADRDVYVSQSDARATSAEERGHAAVIQSVAAKPSGSGGLAGTEIARAEPWHRGAYSGNNLRAPVLGANDGLVSNFCLIMGIAGAGAASRDRSTDRLSGEWLSVMNARELAQTQMAKRPRRLSNGFTMKGRGRMKLEEPCA